MWTAAVRSDWSTAIAVRSALEGLPDGAAHRLRRNLDDIDAEFQLLSAQCSREQIGAPAPRAIHDMAERLARSCREFKHNVDQLGARDRGQLKILADAVDRTAGALSDRSALADVDLL
jgi:hypothetical protein